MKIKQHNSKWPYIPDHQYRLLIIGSSESGNTNSLLNLYAKDPNEGKYQFLINKRESTGLKHFLMIVKLLLKIQMICRMFTKILKSTI